MGEEVGGMSGVGASAFHRTANLSKFSCCRYNLQNVVKWAAPSTIKCTTLIFVVCTCQLMVIWVWALYCRLCSLCYAFPAPFSYKQKHLPGVLLSQDLSERTELRNKTVSFYLVETLIGGKPASHFLIGSSWQERSKRFFFKRGPEKNILRIHAGLFMVLLTKGDSFEYDMDGTTLAMPDYPIESHHVFSGSEITANVVKSILQIAWKNSRSS